MKHRRGIKLLQLETPQGPAWVIDCVIPQDELELIDDFRKSLKLDSKRPTVDRRFFQNADIARQLKAAIQACLPSPYRDDVHVLRYQRFLEYSKSGTELDPHTDGTKVCEDTQKVSTHTMLLYLTDSAKGGETVLLNLCKSYRIHAEDSLESECQNTESDDTDSADVSCENVLHATRPKRGRMLLFPHQTPHAGAIVIDTPKICLRAEVCIGEPSFSN